MSVRDLTQAQSSRAVLHSFSVEEQTLSERNQTLVQLFEDNREVCLMAFPHTCHCKAYISHSPASEGAASSRVRALLDCSHTSMQL